MGQFVKLLNHKWRLKLIGPFSRRAHFNVGNNIWVWIKLFRNKSKSHQNKDFVPDMNSWGKKVIGLMEKSPSYRKTSSHETINLRLLGYCFLLLEVALITEN